MRTIKFRGIRKRLVREVANEWVYGEMYHTTENGDVCIQWWEEGYYKKVEIWKDTVGQFTGLTDINGKEIYEGDIIVQHAEDMPDIRGAVVYDEANARFGMSYTSHWESGAVTHFDTLERVKCYADRNRELTYEVIGNLHDNPDLMLEKDINIFKCEM